MVMAETVVSAPYIGNSHYCYANATAMLLASIGEEVPPATIEVLSGVGLGALWLERDQRLFFGLCAPDQSLSRALDLLGFTYIERTGCEGDPAPLDTLRAALAGSTVVLGPVDMGELSYRPGQRGATGADHFVLAYAMDDREIYLHDPDRYPHVSLPLENLERAWRAERIGYRREPYRLWAAPRRLRSPSEDELYDDAIESFRRLYREADRAAPSHGRLVGSSAILRLAGRVQSTDLSPGEIGHMTAFLFQLAARRALDYAAFFAGRDDVLGALKRRQAEAFGRCHTLAVRADWEALADALQRLTGLEDEFRARLLG